MEPNSLVVKSNKLIEAKYKLNLNEQKIILYAVSKLNRNKDKFNILDLKTNEFTNLIDTSPKRYSEIRKIVKGMMDKKVIINTSKSELITNWVSSIEYIKNTGIIELEFSEKLVPYLLQLKEQYTKYDIKNILYLKNKYSIRIFELLKQYEKIGKREIKIDDLKKMLGCENKYKQFKEFKRNVLEIAKKEVNEHTDIDFEYKKITQGRKVIGIEFIIDARIDQEKWLIDNIYSKKQIKDMKEKSGLKTEKFNSKQCIDLYEIACKKTEHEDIDPYEYIRLNYNEMIKKGTARNKFAYLKKALDEDYAGAVIRLVFNYEIS